MKVMAFKAVFKDRVRYNHSRNTLLSSYCMPVSVYSKRNRKNSPKHRIRAIYMWVYRYWRYPLGLVHFKHQDFKNPKKHHCYYDNASSKKLSLLLQHGGPSCLSNTTDYIIGQRTGRLPMTAKVACASLS